MTARGRLHLGFPLAAWLCATSLAACGSEEGPQVQTVAFCQGDPVANYDDGMLVVEWRQGSEVVATASGAARTVFSAEVPIGGIQIYVDDEYAGSVNEGVPTDGPGGSPTRGSTSYLAAGEGCPATSAP